MASSRLRPSTGTRRRRYSTTTPLSAARADCRGRAARVDTGKHTGRSPKDKFVVREPGSEDRIWWGDVNAEISEEHFEGLREKVVAHLGGSATSTSSTPSPAPIRSSGSPSASSRTTRTTRSSPGRCSSTRRGGAARVRAAGARPARARARGRSRRGRHAHGHVRRAAPVARGGADRRHVLCGRDQEVDLHADERPPAARGRLPDALLGERRRREGTSRSSSASPAPARRRSRPIRSAS